MAKGDIIKDSYEIIQSVEIGGLEIVVAESMAANQPYMTWRRSFDQPFGAESHLIPVLDIDYIKILREFVRSQSVCVDTLDLGRVYRGPALSDYALNEQDCVPGGMDGDLKGKVVAIRADILLPEYRSRSHQMFLAQGGSGCSPTARGRLVFGTNLYSGEHERWNRSDILGVIDEIRLPDWAEEKLDALRAPAEKESVMEKIREAKAAVRTATEQPTQDRKRGGHKKSYEREV